MSWTQFLCNPGRADVPGRDTLARRVLGLTRPLLVLLQALAFPGLSGGLPGLGAHDACPDCRLDAAAAPMPVMPIPRRVRSFHGPHTTCLHAACGPARASRLARTKYNNFDVYVRARWLYGFIRFLLYFSCSLFTAALWGALAALFCLQYLGVRVLLRFQLKLSVLLLLLGRRRVDFRLLNELLIYGIHVTMLLVGGLGWCFMVFVDM
ncbi:hypothetical protein HPG69_018929 [Diceros bicornis minor]|uniref:Transmembrane protein 250 n=1 Tax=Diceros bicornis minor TaxID=77932 RepID=A0A7J7EHK4_DICBM|nr:hypothetical protein HPG69_018929 [Diceros bicornis minor]